MRSVPPDQKWCTACKGEHPLGDFGKDRSRADGLAASCRASRSTGRPRGWHGRPNINPVTGKPGPVPRALLAGPDGDVLWARQVINQEVKRGLRPHPNFLSCESCGHEWREGERRHEYHHHKGYDSGHHFDVESLCTTCHVERHIRAERTRDTKGRWCL